LNILPAAALNRASLMALVIALAASAIAPFDRTTWLLETLPVFLGVPLLVWIDHRRQVTRLLFLLVVMHSLVLVYGGAYTYARVPLGVWMQDWFGLARNNYDKIGHFMQGFVPALIGREVLLRAARLGNRRFLAFLCVCISLAVSACYELVEWLAALALGQGADDFLGTQGDPWDTQSDMLMALIGATASMALLSGLHDRALTRLRRLPA
jgi:putative membrane protein